MKAVSLYAVLLTVFLPFMACGSQLDDGTIAYNNHDYRTAIGLWKPLADQGDADAQDRLGTLYFSGLGVKTNYKRAAGLFRLAANQGNAHSQYMLGMMYAGTQYGVEQDYSEALFWYLLAESKQTSEKLAMATAVIRGNIAAQLSPDQRAIVEQRVKEWKPTRMIKKDDTPWLQGRSPN